MGTNWNPFWFLWRWDMVIRKNRKKSDSCVFKADSENSWIRALPIELDDFVVIGEYYSIKYLTRGRCKQSANLNLLSFLGPRPQNLSKSGFLEFWRGCQPSGKISRFTVLRALSKYSSVYIQWLNTLNNSNNENRFFVKKSRQVDFVFYYLPVPNNLYSV